jgi:hypothetical protein
MQEWSYNLLMHKILQMAMDEVFELYILNFVFISCVYFEKFYRYTPITHKQMDIII